MARPEIPKLIVSIDLGGSLTKVAAATDDGRYCLLTLRSEVSEIPALVLKDLQAGVMGEPNPDSINWVAVKDGSAFAVGNFAKNKLKSQINLKLSKTELAIPKILSLFWVLKYKLDLPDKFYALIGILLPAGECSRLDKEELQESLLPALKGFNTPTGKMSVYSFTKELLVKPEGVGVFYRQLQQKADLSGCTGILGIGFRNANLLVSNGGMIAESDRYTSELGFSSLIGRTKELVGSSIDETQLAAIVAQAGYKINSRIIKRFLDEVSKTNRLERIIESIVNSQTLYWNQLLNWFRYVQIDSCDKIIFYGGTTEYLRESLTEYFADRQLSWHSEVKVPLDLLISAPGSQLGLGPRFVDCWCLFQFLCQQQEGFAPYIRRVEELVAVGGIS